MISTSFHIFLHPGTRTLSIEASFSESLAAGFEIPCPCLKHMIYPAPHVKPGESNLCEMLF